MQTHHRLLPALALTFNAFVFGVSWWPFRRLLEAGLHPLWATALIFVFSLACVVALRPGHWRSFAREPLLWLLMLASGLTNVGFNWAVTVGDVVRVVLLFYLMPGWAVLLAWPLLGERPTAGALFRLTLALAGVAVVLKSPEVAWPVPVSLADWLALMGGFAFALTNILLKRLAHTPGPSRMMAMFGGGAALSIAVALLGAASGLVEPPPPPTLQWLPVALGISVAFLLGNLALQYGAARLTASATALIMLTEVLFASLSASLLGAGEITPRTLLGGSLILLASCLSVLGQGKTAALERHHN